MAGLPKTVRAAMEIVKAMGIHYLWIDSLCIVQDDVDDKRKQIGRMDRIFGNAVFTVVAADGADANSGIAGLDLERKVEQIVEEVRKDVNVLVPLHYESALDPWNSRAWTLQEMHLSKRLLVSHRGQVRFHCRRRTFHEDMTAHDAGAASSMEWLSPPDASSTNVVKIGRDGGSHLMRSPVFDQYSSLIQEYTHRRMSKPTDVINAAAGLPKILELGRSEMPSDQQTPRTLHGLPDEYLDLALLWQPADGACVKLCRREFENVPSWSWAAWEPATNHLKDCNKKACDDKCVQHDGGMRYEAPFSLRTYNKASQTYKAGSLRKQTPHGTQAEERVQPIIHWHRWMLPPPPEVPTKPAKLSRSVLTTPNLQAEPGASRSNGTTPPPRSSSRCSSSAKIPVLEHINGHGMSLSSHPSEPPKAWMGGFKSLSASDYARRPPDDRHLIFRAGVATFTLGSTRFRKEQLWRGDKVEREMCLHETGILDGAARSVVGRLVLPDPDHPPQGRLFDFIAISESQYFGDEEAISSTEYPLFNVLMVEWDEEHVVASRLALGKIYKRDWHRALPAEQAVVLG